MKEKERNILLKAISKRKKFSLKSKKSAISHLIKIGILNNDGDESPRYF